MITAGPGMVDQATASLRRKRGPVKDILVVTGRADICVMLQGSIDEINSTIIDFKKIKGIVTTETMNRGGGEHGLVRAVMLVKSPKKLIAARLRKIKSVESSFPVSGQFDAVAVVRVDDLPQIKAVAAEIHAINGVERTETMVEVV